MSVAERDFFASEPELDVSVAPAFSIFYWIFWLPLVAAVTIFTLGVGTLLLPLLAWYKMAVVNRTRIRFERGSNRFTFERGRWFVKDDDVVTVKSVDNVKLDRSLPGKMFGWCNIQVETRSEMYQINNVSTVQAERFRRLILEMV